MEKGGAWAPGCVIQQGGQIAKQSTHVGCTRGQNQNLGSLRFSLTAHPNTNIGNTSMAEGLPSAARQID